VGVPLMPAGGSFWSRLKSRIRRLRAGVLIFDASAGHVQEGFGDGTCT
jgi:hypothetical protein